MRYMGSKVRIAKYILPIILKDRKPEQYYVEPFCGGCNSIDKVADGPRIAADINPYLIALYKDLQADRKFALDVPKPVYNAVRDILSSVRNAISNFCPHKQYCHFNRSKYSTCDDCEYLRERMAFIKDNVNLSLNDNFRI